MDTLIFLQFYLIVYYGKRILGVSIDLLGIEKCFVFSFVIKSKVYVEVNYFRSRVKRRVENYQLENGVRVIVKITCREVIVIFNRHLLEYIDLLNCTCEFSFFFQVDMRFRCTSDSVMMGTNWYILSHLFQVFKPT